MIINAHTLDDGAILDADICIVGAGAAGLAIAETFRSTSHRVVVLEAGGEGYSKAAQQLYEGELAQDQSHPPPHMYRQRRLGGSTTIWGGRCVPFDPIDFEARDYVPHSGWPFGFETVEAYYPRAQAYLDAGAYDYRAESAMPAGQGQFIDGFSDPDMMSDVIERFSLPTDVFRKLKATLAGLPNIHIVSNATCLSLDTIDGRRVESARCITGGEKGFTVRAGRFVAAAGGLETVRLLFNSDREHERGLGNSHDLLGRFYMCHLEAGVGAMQLSPADRPVRYGFDRTRDGVYTRRKFTLSAAAQRRLQVLNVSVRLHHDSVMDARHRDPILSSMFLAKRFLIPEYRRKFSVLEHAAGRQSDEDHTALPAHLRNVVLGSPRLALFTADWTWRRYMKTRRLPYVALHSARGTYPLDINGEQAPDPDSRVTLGESRDRHGQRRLRVDWRMNALDQTSIATSLRFMRDRMEASGCGTIAFDDAALEEAVAASVPVGGHHIGGARSGATSRTGVVDENLRVHGVDNLYVASAACFPTSSHANPTLTLVALSLRIADHLKSLLAKPGIEAAA